MNNILFTIPAVLLVFVLPGLSLARLFQLQFANIAERLFYAVSLSFAAVVAIGFVLGNTLGINSVTVLGSFLLVGGYGAMSVFPKIWSYLSKEQGHWQSILQGGQRVRSEWFLVALLALAVTAFNWSPGIGTHAIDMGEHVFWAKTIMTTSRLPDYFSVEPLDQAVKFTYGAHLMLAQFFLLAGIPIEEYSWIPTLIGSIGIWLGIVLFTHRVTGSRWAAVVAGVLYGSAYQPAGYIERGNLPDVAGYLLLISTLYSVLRVRRTSSFSYPLGLTAVSVIAYHQLATVILPTVILFAIVFSSIRSRPELAETLRSILAGRAHRSFWVAMLLLTLVYAGTATYVTASAASQLVTGNWRHYVAPLYNDPVVPGIALGVLGMTGLVIILPRRMFSFILLLAWTTSLIFLANALLVGIPIPDPGRFLWRLTEPFSILGAILSYSVVDALHASRQTPLAHGLAWTRRSWIRMAGTFLIVAIIAIEIAGLVAPALEGTPDVFSLPPRYRPTEVFYQDDKRIGQWLAANASSTSVIVNDADVDQTATWVQAWSMKLHFIYRADFAAIVAPANYIEIYKSAAILYESPSDNRVPQIILRYNITYVIARTDEIRLFSASPFFMQQPVFESGGVALFAPKVG